jgi:hypothetical protein
MPDVCFGSFAAISGRPAQVRSYLKSRHWLAQYAAARCNVLCRRYGHVRLVPLAVVAALTRPPRRRWQSKRFRQLAFAALITAKARPKGENVVDLMEALKRSNEAQATKGKKPRKAAAGQKEMLSPISGKRTAKQDAKKADKPAAARGRKHA